MAGKKRTYIGKDISISFELQRCIHSEQCGKRLSSVFDAHRSPWVDPDGADRGTISDVISHCPSGALHAYDLDGAVLESFDGPIDIVIDDNGPLILKGNIEILNTDGDVVHEETRLTLCRCGRSENKPFCDNSHVGHFDAASTLGTSKTGEHEDTPSNALLITPRPDGPYILKGNFRITQSAEPKTVIVGSKAALCRCGESSNKPFCDGAHRSIGFTAD